MPDLCLLFTETSNSLLKDLELISFHEAEVSFMDALIVVQSNGDVIWT